MGFHIADRTIMWNCFFRRSKKNVRRFTKGRRSSAVNSASYLRQSGMKSEILDLTLPSWQVLKTLKVSPAGLIGRYPQYRGMSSHLGRTQTHILDCLSFSEPADESFSINQDASTTPEKDVGRAQKSSVNGDNEKEALPPLQVAGGNPGGLDPVTSDDVEPNSFDLVMPADDVQRPAYLLDRRSELMFSRTHLQAIFDDSSHLHHFTSFLYEHRPASAPLLTYYLNALKALRAIEYSNSVVRQLRPLAQYGYTCEPSEVDSTVNQTLQAKADIAFDLLAREDLPAYITHTWIRIVTVSVRHRIRGTLPHASEGLAEVFCLTDPSRRDNPIILASEGKCHPARPVATVAEEAF